MEKVSRIDMSDHNMSRLNNVNSRKFCIIAFSILFVTLLSQVKSLLDTVISLFFCLVIQDFLIVFQAILL